MLRLTLSQRNKSKGILVWYARVFDTETKEIRYISLGTEKKTQAKDLMAAKLASGDFAKVTSVTLGKVLDDHIKEAEQRELSQNTISSYYQTERIFKPLRNKELSTLVTEDVIQCLDACENLKPTTWNRYRAYFFSLLHFTERFYNDVSINKLLFKIPPKKYLKNPKKNFWTMEQIKQILDNAPNKEIRLGWAFMAYAGLRRTEATNIKPENLKAGYIELVGKGSKFAKIPIFSELQKEIDLHGLPFDLSEYREPLYYFLKKVVKSIFGSNKAFPHMFRYSLASNLIRSGVDVKSVSKIMRHENITLTLNIYAQLFDEDLKTSIEKLNTLDKE